MPRIIVLHDYTNPVNEVPVDADMITTVVPYEGGKGSTVTVGNNSVNVSVMNVKEKPEEVQKLWKKIGHEGKWH